MTASTWIAEGMETFLTATEADTAWLVPDILAPGCMTQLYAPRGLGKSVFADHWAVTLAASGKRVLILDRDNPRCTIQTRLRNLGADGLDRLKVISREKCPPLTKPEQWAAFPYSEYDVIIVDSLDAMAEGIGEQDSSKPARAMAPLLDICRREGGPGVLLLGNTIKSAAHSRGSGVIEDRADIVYELRDGTDFRPTGQKPWIEELPAQGASEWTARSVRRKGRTTFRLALVATKFRLGEEPSPRMWEVCLADLPWTVTDVTASIDAAGEAERLRLVLGKRAMRQDGVSKLASEIERRAATGLHPILKTEAEALLMAARFTRKEARATIADGCFVAISVPGKGHPMELHLHGKDGMAEKREPSNPSKDGDFTKGNLRRPHVEHLAEINSIQTRMNKGDFQLAISAADTPLTVEIPPATEPEGASGQGLFFELEV
jgi:hypothetical protein